jgi:hypothetical protein
MRDPSATRAARRSAGGQSSGRLPGLSALSNTMPHRR